MIRIRGLRKSFGKITVLRGVDLDFSPGKVTAILGPNAAGKTTLIKSILGLTKPDSGSIELDGSFVNGSPEYRSRIGYMAQLVNFPANLRAKELLAMLSDIRRPTETDMSLLHAFCLEGQMDKPVKTLSGGTRQKLNAVVAFMFRPDVLILDEPTAGLDPVASGILKSKIVDARSEGKTILLTSHVISEVEELADDAVFMLDGCVRFSGRVDSLKARTGKFNLERALAALLEDEAV